MIRHTHIHRILTQAEKEGFLEEAAFELGLAGLREGRGGAHGDKGEAFLAYGSQQAEDGHRM